MENDGYDVINFDDKNLALLFSHNIHGETHPCGCRHFPLGGLAQVAGQIEKIKRDHNIIYIDSGDTLFDSTKIPDTLKKSRIYNAKGLAKGLSDVGLNYWTPGDYDFANGVDFISQMAKEHKFNILVSNLRSPSTFPHKEFVVIEKGPHRIFLTGIIHPSVFNDDNKKLFLSPNASMPKLLDKIKKAGFKENNPFHRLVLVSHAGKDNDDLIAKKFPQITWIIGAHTQNFYREAQEVNKTKIVQVLSRNHYFGQVTFDLSKDKTGDSYKIHEIRDELKDELKPNPFIKYITDHKNKLKEVRIKEQELMVTGGDHIKYSTGKACLDCHEPQAEFWQGTSHSVAYATLIKSGEENNLTCVKCHSLGLSDVKGFTRVKDIIEVDKDSLKKTTVDAVKEKYWNDVRKAFAPVKSIRKLTPKKRRKLAQSWDKLDSKHGINRNFANVQCLNCHTKHDNHPWDNLQKEKTQNSHTASMKTKCLECHNPDQSPEWYDKMPNGIPGKLNQDTLNKKFKEISCPKRID
jgi:hypothetical protein